MKLAVIPARGGSKRIPRKNIRPFAGLPMIAHSIRAAQAAQLFDRIIVSTDDEEITAVARAHGAEVPFLRPAELADDFATTWAVVQHAIRAMQGQGMNPEYTCCIYATAPFLQAAYLQQAFTRLAASDKSYAFSVAHYDFPVQRALRLTADGGVDALYPEYRQTRSQDLEEAVHDAGQFYWGRSAAFLRSDVLFSPASLPVLLPPHLVQDIDTPDDWKRAELMFAAIQADLSQ